MRDIFSIILWKFSKFFVDHEISMTFYTPLKIALLAIFCAKKLFYMLQITPKSFSTCFLGQKKPETYLKHVCRTQIYFCNGIGKSRFWVHFKNADMSMDMSGRRTTCANFQVWFDNQQMVMICILSVGKTKNIIL